jgi:hypothetical protein
MWPECGADYGLSVEVGYRRAWQNVGAVAFPAKTHNRKKARRILFLAPVLRGGKVDKNSGQSLYTLSSGALPPSAMARPRSPSLFTR